MKLSKKKLLSKAFERIFSLAVEDAGSIVSIYNTAYGFGKILFALMNRGIDVNHAICVFGPDASVTRNYSRWRSGFGYGCKIVWPGREIIGEDILFPEVRPNACGMLVSLLEEPPPNHRKLVKRAFEIIRSGLTLDGHEVHWNIGEGNHFLEVYRVESSKLEGVESGSYMIILHVSPDELKRNLYNLEEFEGVWEQTPLGKIYVLEGQEARRYYRMYREIEGFGKRKREKLIEGLFNEEKPRTIVNSIHQGLKSINEMHLGLYNSLDSSTSFNDEPLFPFVMRWDLPAYIIKGERNLSDEAIEMAGLRYRAEKIGVMNVLRKINILPHGAGYNLFIGFIEARAIDMEGTVWFKSSTKGSPYIFSNPRELPYTYRGENVLSKILEHGLGRIVVKLKQVYTLKA